MYFPDELWSERSWNLLPLLHLCMKKIDWFRSGVEHSRTGGEHSALRAHTSTKSRSWAWRNHTTLTKFWRSKGLWRWVFFFVERPYLLTAVSVVARAWRYRLCRSHAPGLLLRMWSVGWTKNTVIHFYFGSVQFSVKRNFAVSVRRKVR